MSITPESRRLQLPAPLLLSLLSAVAAGRSPDDAATLLRRAGYDAGQDLFGSLQAHVARGGSDGSLSDLPAPEFWDVFAAFWESLGWGTLEHQQTHDGVAELVSQNWVEADATADGLGCQVTTGLLAEILRHVAGDEVAILEPECRGRGDARCRFLIGAPATLDSLYGMLRDGHSPQEVLSQLR